MYSGIIFDFDGVLYDSEKHWHEVENRYLSSRIESWDWDDYRHLIGRSLPEAYEYLVTKGFTLEKNQYFDDYHKMADELYAKYAKPLDNVDQLLLEIGNKRKKAIASSSKHSWIETAMVSSPLAMPITIVASAEDKEVVRGKPAPDVYLYAAKLLQENPAKLIAIEDSTSGVASAKAAGLYCFGLRNGFNSSQNLDKADRIIEGYSVANIAAIVGMLA